MIPLSILDLSVVTTGTKPAAALRNSIDLARHADALGYVRYWLAEHHNLASVASPAPDIMIGQIAAVTNRIRVGSGGVMLPNHAPLMVAERFKMLEALFPGRIDLGFEGIVGDEGGLVFVGAVIARAGGDGAKTFDGGDERETALFRVGLVEDEGVDLAAQRIEAEAARPVDEEGEFVRRSCRARPCAG